MSPRFLSVAGLIHGLLGLLLAAIATMARAEPSLPRDAGLPVVVELGVAYVDLDGFDENAGVFRATVDIRLRWTDSRLADTGAAPRTFTGQDAESQIAAIWVPPILVANQKGPAIRTSQALRIQPSGLVELTRRITADFGAEVDPGRFPFDRQKLPIEAKIDGLPLSQVTLRFSQSELDFSRPARDAGIPGWTIGLIDLRASPVTGWYNVPEARIVAALDVSRKPGLLVASIFIPLLASLLIPLLAMWLNRIEDGIFQVDTFELVNIIIGGLFAVIALNFTIYSTYAVLADGDNTVNRLFALNYMALAIALLVNIAFSRFNVVARLWGPWVQEQTYQALMWLIPLGVTVLAAAFLVMAYL